MALDMDTVSTETFFGGRLVLLGPCICVIEDLESVGCKDGGVAWTWLSFLP
jgi:hypothetical protein